MDADHVPSGISEILLTDEQIQTRLAEVERTKSPKRSAKLAGREHELSAFEGDGE